MNKSKIWILCFVALLILGLFTSCKSKDEGQKDDGKKQEVELPAGDLEEDMEMESEGEDSANKRGGSGTASVGTHCDSNSTVSDIADNSDGNASNNIPTNNEEEDNNNTSRESIILPGIKID